MTLNEWKRLESWHTLKACDLTLFAQAPEGARLSVRLITPEGNTFDGFTKTKDGWVADPDAVLSENSIERYVKDGRAFFMDDAGKKRCTVEELAYDATLPIGTVLVRIASWGSVEYERISTDKWSCTICGNDVLSAYPTDIFMLDDLELLARANR